MRTKADKKLTDHHRRPTSIGGSKFNFRNRADVPADIHGTFHEVFENLCGPEQVKLMNSLIASENVQVSATRKPNPVHTFLCPSDGKCCIHWYKRRKYLPKEVAKRQKKGRVARRRRRREAWAELRTLVADEIRDASLEAAIKYFGKYLFDPDYLYQTETI